MTDEEIQWYIDFEISQGLSYYEAANKVMDYVEEAAERQACRASAEIYAGCSNSVD